MVSLRMLALVPAAALAVPAASPPPAKPRAAQSTPAPPRAPAAPPDGTYVYAFSRNGTDQGRTTVTITRRDDLGEFDLNESGYAGAARASIVAVYRYSDLGALAYSGTYRAPFLASSQIGGALGVRARSWLGQPVIVRFRADGRHASVTIDGVAAARTWNNPSPSPKPAYSRRTVIDAPFMATVLLVPALRHRSGDAALAPIGEAFDQSIDVAPYRLVGTPPHDPKTPKGDVALEMRGLGTVWFNRGNDIVDEAYFDGLNIDAHLIAYSRTPLPPVPEPVPTLDQRPHLQSRPLVFTSDDDTKLSGSIDLPVNGKPHAPAVVFVPPAPDADRNYSGDGPDPMYPSLALAFAQRGYAVVRYDGRNAGAAPSAQAATWDNEISDARAAIAAAAGDDAVDPNKLYVLGYGTGADLALVAAQNTDAPLAGAVALGPTVVSYRECSARTHAVATTAFEKSRAAHDPGALAARLRIPAFIAHAGARCGETKDEVSAYDDRVRAADPRATIVVASDLTAQFGGLYDANSTLDTQEFFPYRFDGSTADAIADWLDNPKGQSASGLPAAARTRPHAPPAPPPVSNPELNGQMPNPHQTATPEPEVAPGVVLPSGVTPPPVQVDPATPSPAPSS